MITIKAVDKNYVGHGFHYRIGETYTLPTTDVEFAEIGFHAARHADIADTLNAYPDIKSARYLLVHVDSVDIEDDFVVGSTITILKELKSLKEKLQYDKTGKWAAEYIRSGGVRKRSETFKQLFDHIVEVDKSGMQIVRILHLLDNDTVLELFELLSKRDTTYPEAMLLMLEELDSRVLISDLSMRLELLNCLDKIPDMRNVKLPIDLLIKHLSADEYAALMKRIDDEFLRYRMLANAYFEDPSKREAAKEAYFESAAPETLAYILEGGRIDITDEELEQVVERHKSRIAEDFFRYAKTPETAKKLMSIVECNLYNLPFLLKYCIVSRDSELFSEYFNKLKYIDNTGLVAAQAAVEVVHSLETFIDRSKLDDALFRSMLMELLKFVLKKGDPVAINTAEKAFIELQDPELITEAIRILRSKSGFEYTSFLVDCMFQNILPDVVLESLPYCSDTCLTSILRVAVTVNYKYGDKILEFAKQIADPDAIDVVFYLKDPIPVLERFFNYVRDYRHIAYVADRFLLDDDCSSDVYDYIVAKIKEKDYTGKIAYLLLRNLCFTATYNDAQIKCMKDLYSIVKERDKAGSYIKHLTDLGIRAVFFGSDDKILNATSGIQYILQKMCQMVGCDYNTFDFNKPDWFHSYEWTDKQQEEFRNRLISAAKQYSDVSEALCGAKKVTKKLISKAADAFIFNYGWRLKC